MKHLVLHTVHYTTALANLCDWSLDYVEYTKNLEISKEGDGVFSCYIPHEADLVGSMTIHIPPENIEWIKICDRPKVHNPTTNTFWFQEKLPNPEHLFLCDGTEPRPWTVRELKLQTEEERKHSGIVRFKIKPGFYKGEEFDHGWYNASVRLRMLSQKLRPKVLYEPDSFGLEGF